MPGLFFKPSILPCQPRPGCVVLRRLAAPAAERRQLAFKGAADIRHFIAGPITAARNIGGNAAVSFLDLNGVSDAICLTGSILHR